MTKSIDTRIIKHAVNGKFVIGNAKQIISLGAQGNRIQWMQETKKQKTKILRKIYLLHANCFFKILINSAILLVSNTVMKLIPRFSLISLACLRSLVNTFVATMTLLFRLTSSSGLKWLCKSSFPLFSISAIQQ